MIITAFLLGLMGSFHCIGMCGPIALLLPIERKNKRYVLAKTFIYHTGRIFCYLLLGLVFGLIGNGISLAGFQQIITIATGSIIIIMVIAPYSFIKFPKISSYLYSFTNRVKGKLGVYLNTQSNTSLFYIGFFNGLLPCGLVYLAIANTLSLGDITNSILYMFLFGLGTIPLMSLLIFSKNFITNNIRNKIQKQFLFL